MPADIADIAAATREAVVVDWSDAAIRTTYPTARDGSLDVAEGFFDDADDAQEVINARALLLGAPRRRMSIDIADLVWLDPSAASPTVMVVDDEQGVSGPMLVARAEVDLEEETTQLEVFG